MVVFTANRMGLGSWVSRRQERRRGSISESGQIAMESSHVEILKVDSENVSWMDMGRCVGDEPMNNAMMI